MSRSLDKAVEYQDLVKLAKRRLPKALYDQLTRGSEDDIAYAHNRRVIEDIKLIPRAFTDISRRDTSVSLWGRKQALPIIIAPTGISSWISYRGETALARVAARANIPFVLTSTSSTPLEQNLAEGGGDQWYNATIWRDVETSIQGIMRAKEAGFEALVLTTGGGVPYNRPFEKRSRLRFPIKFRPSHLIEGIRRPKWAVKTPLRYLLRDGHLPQLTNIPLPPGTPPGDPSFFIKSATEDWDFLTRMRDLWPGKLILKGILHPDDAIAAVKRGVDGIVVSNQGGATNDSAPSPLEMLPGIAAAVEGKSIVIIDSGFRRGSDVLKALALGADAVMVGRTPLYGLGAEGEVGAERAIQFLSEEIDRTMGALGLRNLREIGRDHVALPSDFVHLGAEQTAWKGLPAHSENYG